MFPLFVRSIKFLIGLGFVGVLMLALLGTISGLFTDPPQPTAERMEMLEARVRDRLQ